MSPADATMLPAGPRHAALKIAAALLIGLKLYSLVAVNLVSDEAYYWMWGQHPALSYFDHPPLNAWLIGIADALFGRGIVQLRVWAVPTFVGTVWIFRSWARQFGGDDWEGVFWRSLVIYLAAPVFGVYSTFGTSDHLLFFFILLSAHFLIPYLQAVREGRAALLRNLYLGSGFLGIAALAKYNTLLFGVALGLYIVASPRLRRLLASPHLYLAALLALVVASPILIWNIQNGFASFEFHLVDRHDTGFMHDFTWKHIVEFLLQTALTTSPFMMWGMVKFVLSRPREPFERTAWGLGSWFFWLSSIVFLFVALTQQLFFWWNVSAYVLLLPFLGKAMRSGLLFWGHTIFGTFISVLYVVSSSIFPVILLLDRPDPTRTRYYGWDEIAQPVEAAIAELHPDFIAASKWEYASTVGFAIDDPDVVAINPARSEFHYWFKPSEHAGQDALVVLHDGRQKEVVDRQFEKLTLYREIPIVRFGRELGRYRLYWGENYQPSY